MQISEKDKKLLVYLLALAIIWGTYFFGAKPLLDKQAAISEEVQTLQTDVAHYSEIYNNQESYEGRIAEAQRKYNESSEKFFGGLNQDNTIMMVKDLENISGVWISRVSFQDETVIFGQSDAAEEVMDDSSAEGTADSAAESTDESVGDTVSTVANLKGIRQDLNIDYAAKYDDFKRLIEYIENYDERLFITSISASYAVDSGLVGGSIVLSQYALTGTDREYKAPDLSDVRLGNESIFKTGVSLLAPDSEEGTEAEEAAEESDQEADENDSEADRHKENNENNADTENTTENKEEKAGPSKPQGPSGGII